MVRLRQVLLYMQVYVANVFMDALFGSQAI
jgi:hypothetical protein